MDLKFKHGDTVKINREGFYAGSVGTVFYHHDYNLDEEIYDVSLLYTGQQLTLKASELEKYAV